MSQPANILRVEPDVPHRHLGFSVATLRFHYPSFLVWQQPNILLPNSSWQSPLRGALSFQRHVSLRSDTPTVESGSIVLGLPSWCCQSCFHLSPLLFKDRVREEDECHDCIWPRSTLFLCEEWPLHDVIGFLSPKPRKRRKLELKLWEAPASRDAWVTGRPLCKWKVSSRGWHMLSLILV